MDFILGSGIVGAVSSFYLKDYTILTRGNGQDGMRMGPKYIKKTKYTDSLIDKINQRLKEYNFDTIGKYKLKFAYSMEDGLVENIADEEVAKLIYKIVKQTELTSEDIESFKNVILNGGETTFEAYLINDVYHALATKEDFRTRRMFVDIKKINTKKHTIEGINPRNENIKFSFNYEHILNTLPAPMFNSVIDNSVEKANNTEVIIYIIKSKELFKSMGDNDFIYYLDNKIPFYRLTKIGTDIVAMESRKLFFTKNFIKERHIVLNTIRLPFGNIEKEVQLKQRTNIKHVGCYANNDNSLRVHNVIEMFEKGEFDL